MNINKNNEHITSLIQELLTQPNETEWLEFKHDNDNPEMIGKYISALSNSAALNGKSNAYVMWGIDDRTHEILGTTFTPFTSKKNNEPLENWLLRSLKPKIDFKFYSTDFDGRMVVLLEIAPAYEFPTSFSGTEYIRVGSCTKKLQDLSVKERELWRVFDKVPFEKQISADNLTGDEVLEYLEYKAYFALLKLHLPESRDLILESLGNDDLIQKNTNGKYDITNLGAILFARDLKKFNNLKRKAIRVIQYRDKTKSETIKEVVGSKGYAIAFEGLIRYINGVLPSNEIIKQALREDVSMYPELSIREIVANAIIHQDFFQSGNSVMIEIFINCFEVTNPGAPLVDIDRLLDSAPKSRNEALASFMRRIGVCEERGSGIDKVVLQSEIHQLPAPIFETSNETTIAILFSHKELRDMDKSDKTRACYKHSSLRYVQRDYMTNTSLRERLGIGEENRSMVSKIINFSLEEKRINIYDTNVGTKARKYVPWRAK